MRCWGESLVPQVWGGKEGMDHEFEERKSRIQVENLGAKQVTSSYQ